MLKHQNIKGFTLVEVMVSLLLLGVVLTAGYGVLTTGSIIYLKDDALLTMQQQMRNALDRIVREARPASSQAIVNNYNGTGNGAITIISPTTPSPGVSYYLDGTNLVRSYGGISQNVASNVTSLTFTLNASLLQIQATASTNIYNTATTFSLVDKARLRNQ